MGQQRRRVFAVVFTLFLVVITLAGIEIAAMGYLHYLIDSPKGPKEVIQQSLGTAGYDGIRQQTGVMARDVDGGRLRIHSLHPYLGFVLNYDADRTVFNERVLDIPINEYGFLGNTPYFSSNDDTIVVALMGGSVAAELFVDARDELRNELQRLVYGPGKDIVIASIAIGGWKQPQQLMALSYLLSLGAHFDIIVNLDGFNEVALPLNSNIRFGVFPFFPRNWRLYASRAVDPADIEIYGRISQETRSLEQWRTRLSGSALRESYFFLAIWHSFSQKIHNRLLAFDEELRSNLAKKTNLSAQVRGPNYSTRSQEVINRDLANVWARSSNQMSNLCRANDIAYFHFLQPNQYVSGSKILTAWELENTYKQNPNFSYRRGAEQGYPHLLSAGEQLREKGVFFYDLTQVFKEVSGNIYKDTCCHYNHRGYDLVAKHIARNIAETLSPE